MGLLSCSAVRSVCRRVGDVSGAGACAAEGVLCAAIRCGKLLRDPRDHRLATCSTKRSLQRALDWSMIERIDPTDPRVVQANERTLLSWVRTGLALMAFGFVVERLALWFDTEAEAKGQTATLVIGAAIVGLGAVCHVLGTVRFIAVKRALEEGRTPPAGTAGPVVLAVLSALVGIALFVFLLAS